MRITRERARRTSAARCSPSTASPTSSPRSARARGRTSPAIAHEIKNPLTPIALRRAPQAQYGAADPDRPRDLRQADRHHRAPGRRHQEHGRRVRLVRARVPKPVMALDDLRQAVQEPVILFREGHPGIAYDLVMPETPLMGSFDRRLVSQAVTNLVKKNATGGRRGRGRKRRVRAEAGRGASRRASSRARIASKSRSSTTALACRGKTAHGCSSPTSRQRVTRAPGSALLLSKRSPSSTAARWRSRTHPPRRTGAAARSCASPCRAARAARLPDDSDDTPGPAPAVAVRREPEPQPSRGA